MRLFTIIVLIEILLGSHEAGAQALRKKGEMLPPAKVDQLAAQSEL
jgi:hypothetical protein